MNRDMLERIYGSSTRLEPEEAMEAQDNLLLRQLWGCLIAGGKPSKDGHIWSGQRKNRFAHEDAYEKHFGLIDHSVIVIHHLCLNKPCIQPQHLVALFRRFHSQLHTFGMENGGAKGDCETVKVAFIAAKLKLEKYSEIANVCGFSESKVKLLATGKTWNSVTAHLLKREPWAYVKRYWKMKEERGND